MPAPLPSRTISTRTVETPRPGPAAPAICDSHPLALGPLPPPRTPTACAASMSRKDPRRAQDRPPMSAPTSAGCSTASAEDWSPASCSSSPALISVSVRDADRAKSATPSGGSRAATPWSSSLLRRRRGLRGAVRSRRRVRGSRHARRRRRSPQGLFVDQDEPSSCSPSATTSAAEADVTAHFPRPCPLSSRLRASRAGGEAHESADTPSGSPPRGTPGLFLLLRLRRFGAPVPPLAAPEVHALHVAALHQRPQNVVRRWARHPTHLRKLPHAGSRPLLDGLEQTAAILPARRTTLRCGGPSASTGLLGGLAPNQNGPGGTQSIALLHKIIPPTESLIDLTQPPIDIHHLPLHELACGQPEPPLRTSDCANT